MNLSKYIIQGILFFSLLSCKSPSDKAAENFRKVNDELKNSNKRLDSARQRFKKLRNFDQETIDSIELILRKAIVYIGSIQMDLDIKDRKGERIDVAEQLLINTSKGDSLYMELMAVYDLGIKYADDESERQKFILLREFDKDKWLEKHFRRVPTIAARTIVSKFQNDCALISAIVWTVDTKEIRDKINSQ